MGACVHVCVRVCECVCLCVRALHGVCALSEVTSWCDPVQIGLCDISGLSQNSWKLTMAQSVPVIGVVGATPVLPL
jgi:hypothetical protein